MSNRVASEAKTRAAIFCNARPAFRRDPSTATAPDEPADTPTANNVDAAAAIAATLQQAEEHPSGKPDAAALSATLQTLVERANTGAPASLDALRDFLADHPEIEQHVGDLARHAETAWLTLVANGNSLIYETTKRQLATVKADLAGEHPTRLEQMLIDQVGVAYLAHQHATIADATISGGSIQQAALRIKRADSSQRRYLTAIKTLSTLRARVPAGLAPLRGLQLHDPGRKLA